MRHVYRAGEPLDRRRLEAVPQGVEESNRDPDVHLPSLRRRGRQAVFPGAGEQDQLISQREPARERPSDFVHVLADPRALAQRRPIVEQDAQGRAMVAQRVVAASPCTSIN